MLHEGYTLPQYCLDNGIKRPLFVSEKKYELFVWQVYVQFHYDKRLWAQFSFLDADKMDAYFPGSIWIVPPLQTQKFATMNFDAFDKIILLTDANVELPREKVVRLAELERFFIRRTYAEIPLLHFLQRYPQVKLILTNFPNIRRYKDGATFNDQLCEVNEFTARLRNDKSGNLKTTLDKFGYTNAQALEIASSPQVKTNPDGTTVMIGDDTKPLQGIKDGRRMTAYQPAHYRNKIYFFGQCVYFGVYAPFDKSIESYLQKKLNEAGLPYCVENYSQFTAGRTQDILYNLNTLSPAPGDIIFVMLEHLSANNNNLPYLDMNGVFDPPHDFREMYCTQYHINELGYELMAGRVFEYLTEHNFFRDEQFTYPLPLPPESSLRHPAPIRDGRLRSRQCGAFRLQAVAPYQTSSNRRNRHELQSFHAGASIPRRIRGGSSRAALCVRG